MKLMATLGHPVQKNAQKNEPFGRRVHISSLVGQSMRPALTVFASLMFFALFAPVAPALPAESLDKGMMFARLADCWTFGIDGIQYYGRTSNRATP